MKYLICSLLAISSLSGCITDSYAKKVKEPEVVNLWVSAEGVPVLITITDGVTTLDVSSGSVIALPSPGDYLIKMVAKPEEIVIPVEEIPNTVPEVEVP